MTLCSLTASSKRQKLLIVTGRSVRTDNHARMPYPIVRIQQCSADNAHVITPCKPSHVLKPAWLYGFYVTVHEGIVRRQVAMSLYIELHRVIAKFRVI